MIKFYKFVAAVLCSWAVLAPSPARADDNAITDERLNLSLNLLKSKMNNATGNFVLSPLSIYMASGLLANGAGGKTLEQLQKKILSPHHNLSLSEINQNLSQYMQNLSPAIKINNSVWGDDFKPEYIESVQSLKAEALDLPESTQVINDWIDDKTNGKIKNVLAVKKPDKRDYYLVNTVYFNDKWASVFDVADTTLKPFHSLGAAQPDDVYMMYQHFSESTNYYENDTFQAVHLLYKHYDVAKEGVDTTDFEARMNFDNFISYPTNYIDFILPKENVDFQQFVRSLTLDDLKIPYRDYPEVELELYLPRFETEYKTPLNGWFKAGGIPLFEDDSEVDLSKLSSIPHYVKDIIHQANIRVDEEGTEAAAATVIALPALGLNMQERKVPPRKVFNADRPFIYIINGGLFIGAYIKGAKLEAKNQ